MKIKKIYRFIFYTFYVFLFSINGQGQNANSTVTRSWQDYLTNKKGSEYSGLRWSLLGPVINSGRIETIDVVPGKPRIIYAGFGSGNLWKTTNNGFSWKPVFDNHAGYSIGDVCISKSNPNIIYLGTGENLRAVRGHTFAGAGVYRSDDGGNTWKALGLKDTYHIGRVAVHPTNSDIVFVAALGHFFSPNQERGLFKSEDGGKSWKKVLFVDDHTGANDVVISPSNPSVVYASTWQCGEAVGGPGSSVFKSTDGGNTWIKIDNGLPSGNMNGRIGLAVSYQNSNRVYAFMDNLNLENKKETGELYRTDNGGINWEKTHKKNLKILSTFGHVFTDCFVNPLNDNEVFVLGVKILRSEDAGRTFTPLGGRVHNFFPSPSNYFHLDNHDMWIDPNDPEHLIVGNDGGLYISYDNALSWIHYNNIPVGEFYFVRTDNDNPYRIYAGTQDDAAVRGPAKVLKDNSPDNWEYVWIDPWSGGDGIVTAPDPENSDIVYYESQNGALRRKVMSTGEEKNIQPKLPKTYETELFHEWLTPFFISNFNPHTLYYGANYVFKSENRGDTWRVISQNLSFSTDSNRCGNGITALEESPFIQGLLYAGTSKGAVWVTKNDGNMWTEISNGLPEKYVKSFAPSRFKKSRIYIALSGIKEDDFTPYLFKSDDYGNTWEPISSNLPVSPVNVVLEDPEFENILYCGTFNGVFISTNRGKSWDVLGSGMPNCFVADMTIQSKNKDLIAATHGRGIYKIDLEPIYKHLQNTSYKDRFLYITRAELPKMDASGQKPDLSGYEPVQFSFFLSSGNMMAISIVDSKDSLVFYDKQYFSKGLNTYQWDLTCIKRIYSDNPYGLNIKLFPKPGEYKIRLKGIKTELEKIFSITDNRNLTHYTDESQKKTIIKK